MEKTITENDALQMICKRAAELWNDPAIKGHIISSIKGQVTEEKIKKYVYKLAILTLYVPVTQR